MVTFILFCFFKNRFMRPEAPTVPTALSCRQSRAVLPGHIAMAAGAQLNQVLLLTWSGCAFKLFQVFVNTIGDFICVDGSIFLRVGRTGLLRVVCLRRKKF